MAAGATTGVAATNGSTAALGSEEEDDGVGISSDLLKSRCGGRAPGVGGGVEAGVGARAGGRGPRTRLTGFCCFGARGSPSLRVSPIQRAPLHLPAALLVHRPPPPSHPPTTPSVFIARPPASAHIAAPPPPHQHPSPASLFLSVTGATKPRSLCRELLLQGSYLYVILSPPQG